MVQGTYGNRYERMEKINEKTLLIIQLIVLFVIVVYSKPGQIFTNMGYILPIGIILIILYIKNENKKN